MADRNRTEDNLKKAFDGEAKAALRLLGFAQKAVEEGYPQMAKMFRAIASAEEVHGLRALRLLKVIRSTEDNLTYSFESETMVSENAYPSMIQEADEEGNEAARIAFSQARDVEKLHAKLYKNAIEHMTAETETTYHVCQVCGYVAEGEAPDRCPICNAKRERFQQVD